MIMFAYLLKSYNHTVQGPDSVFCLTSYTSYSRYRVHMAVGQKSWTKNLILGGHNRHFYMILHFRYVASRKEIPQNTS